MDLEVHEGIKTVVLYARSHNLTHLSLSNVIAKHRKIVQHCAVHSHTTISRPFRSNNIGRGPLHDGRISEVIDVVRRMEIREWRQLRAVQAALSTSFILQRWCANHRSSPMPNGRANAKSDDGAVSSYSGSDACNASCNTTTLV